MDILHEFKLFLLTHTRETRTSISRYSETIRIYVNNLYVNNLYVNYIEYWCCGGTTRNSEIL